MKIGTFVKNQLRDFEAKKIDLETLRARIIEAATKTFEAMDLKESPMPMHLEAMVEWLNENFDAVAKDPKNHRYMVSLTSSGSIIHTFTECVTGAADPESESYDEDTDTCTNPNCYTCMDVAWLVSFAKIEKPDDENEEFLFSLTSNLLLVKIAQGDIDAVQLAKEALKQRGYDFDGQYVGFGGAK